MIAGYDRPEKLLAQRSQLVFLWALAGSSCARQIWLGLVIRFPDETTSIGGHVPESHEKHLLRCAMRCRRAVVDVRKADFQDGRFHRVGDSATLSGIAGIGARSFTLSCSVLRLLRKRRRSSGGLI